MRKETKQQVQELYAGVARFSGAVIAVVAVWFAVSVVVRLLNQEPFGGELLIAIFAGLMAAVLISARAEKPPNSPSRKQN